MNDQIQSNGNQEITLPDVLEVKVPVYDSSNGEATSDGGESVSDEKGTVVGETTVFFQPDDIFEGEEVIN